MKINLLPRIITILTLATILFLAPSCHEKEKYRIGISQCSSDDWRNKMNEEIMREALFHDNVEIEIRSADDSSARQIEDLDYFASNGFDIIVVAPNEADALTPKISEIYEAGIPVIVFDRTVNGDNYTAFQGADNTVIGAMAAQVAANMVGQPRVLEIEGLAGSTPAADRRAGFHGAADSLGFAVLASAYGDWNGDRGRIAADSLLEAHPEANLFYCHNDRMAISAAEAAHARGRDDIRIIGIDAAPAIGIQAVADGTIDATFLYPTAGHQLVRTALAILQGQPYDRELLLPAAAPVDASNASILLLQDNALREETDKISVLQSRMDDFSRRYSEQSMALAGVVIILILFAGIIFLLLRWYWTGKRHRRQMESRNQELARQRDELDELYRQLQEATGSKLTFFTNVSHDLRTPLTLIADPVSTLAQAENLTPRQRTLMQLANKNVKRLQRLINQILDIRKYDSGQLRLNLVNLNLNEALREWTAPFAEMAAHRHIRFNTSLATDEPVITAVDIEKTERILFNLLSNAFKFTPENGTISVSLSREGENEAVIRVSDTGVGIPADEINHIFERFFKTDRINPNGSGIGLALSKVFIDMHGGSITVASDKGKGTVFTVTLPVRTVADGAVQAPTSSLPEADVAEIVEIADEEAEITEDTPTVLVIDDNRDICTLVRSVLSDDYKVLVASSGPQGIRLATRYVPDLVICDVMMPGMDGYKVCKALKSEELTSHIPVLLLTACSRDEQRTEGYECGADAFMSKPFDSAMLMARCKSLIANRQLIYTNLSARAGSPVQPAPAGAEAAPVIEDDFLRRFTSVVEAGMADNGLSVESVASTLGISRVQMYRKIKALTNYSANELIRIIRLKRAATMLKTTSATVSEVAYAVGFSSPGYFTRCYKEYYRETPAETQLRSRGGGEC